MVSFSSDFRSPCPGPGKGIARIGNIWQGEDERRHERDMTSGKGQGRPGLSVLFLCLMRFRVPFLSDGHFPVAKDQKKKKRKEKKKKKTK